jgi:DNA mismatch endonuclease (patch repair protein)
MTDVFSKIDRSRIMSRIRGKDTQPELLIRSLTHRLGFRFRLHRKDLPGKPDLVFAARKKIIFVHGCFWHGHKCPRGDRLPKSNVGYWAKKITRNALRFTMQKRNLKKQGWEILVIWECEIKSIEKLQKKIIHFLGPKNQS